MSDSVAQDQIRAFVDRSLTERGISGDLSAAITGKLDRLHYALDRMVARRRVDSLAITHARRPASELIGARNGELRSRVKSVARRGSVEASLAWLNEWMTTMEPWAVPALNPEWLGHVYVAASEDFPGIYKVGFSRNVDERMRALGYAFRTPMRFVLSFPGTMLDEHLLQHDMRQFSLANEWFDFDGRYGASDKWMRFYRPNRMWAVLHANFGDVSTARKFKMEAA